MRVQARTDCASPIDAFTYWRALRMTTPVKNQSIRGICSAVCEERAASSQLSTSLSHLHPLHFISLNFIDPHADKRQLSAQIYMWELLTLCKSYWVHLNAYAVVFHWREETWKRNIQYKTELHLYYLCAKCLLSD